MATRGELAWQEYKKKNSVGSSQKKTTSESGGAAAWNAYKQTESYQYSRVANDFQNFQNEVNRFAVGLNNRQNLNGADGNKYWEEMQRQADNLRVRRDSLSRTLNEYKHTLSDEGYTSVQKYLDQFDAEMDRYQPFMKAPASFYGFKDEDSYNTWNTYQQKYTGKSYDEVQEILSGLNDVNERNWATQYAKSVMTESDYDKDINKTAAEIDSLEQMIRKYDFTTSGLGLGSTEDDDKIRSDADQLLRSYGFTNVREAEVELENLKRSQWELTNERKYRFLDEAEDFEAASKTVDPARAGRFGDQAYGYINDLNGIRDREARYAEMGYGSSLSVYDQMEADEIQKYNYLYNTQGEESAEAYLEYLEYALNEREMNDRRAEAAAFASKSPFIASAMSIPANLASGVGFLDAAGQNVVNDMKETFTGKYTPVDYNRSSMGTTAFSSAIRGTVAKNITDSTGTIQLDPQKHPILSRILNGKGLGDVYQLGMSMADSATIAMLSPGLGSMGTALLGGSAASQGVLDAVAKGATDDQAIMMGFFNGAFEMLFEKYSLEQLLKGDTKNVVLAFFKQGFAEGSEEFNTTVANNIADILIMAEKSDYRRNVAAYIEQGLSPEEAELQAFWDAAIQAGWDFLGGVASGGIMGSASAPIQNYLGRNAEATALYGSDPGALVSEALEIDPDNTYAQKMQTRLDDGKELSGRQLRKLVDQNEKALTSQDMDAIQKATEARLTELGETADVSAVAAALTKQAAGKKLSGKEQQTIAGSKYGQRVANELNAYNIQNEGYSSDWTGNIGTSRINVDEYSRLIRAAEQPQEAIKAEAETSAVEQTKTAQLPQAAPVEDGKVPAETVLNNRTAKQQPKEASYKQEKASSKQVASKSLQAAEKSSVAEEPKKNAVTLEAASAKYGAQAKAMVKTYQAGQDVEKYDRAYRMAYDMGRSYIAFDYVKKSKAVSYLTDAQKELAYNTGRDAADAKAVAKDAENIEKANGKTGWKKGGVVRGDGVTMADIRKAFNDRRGKAYKSLSTIAKATGVTVVLYKSKLDADGKFVGEQGKFDPDNPNEIWIDINAGLENVSEVEDLERYVLLRTFSHEFTHFIEKWNPIRYNEFRKTVFDTLTDRGQDVDELIELKMKETGLEYEAASREVVADAMTDILPDSTFVQQLAEKHQTVFQKLLEKLKEFLDNLKDFYSSMVDNRDYAANALKEDVDGAVKYVDSIVKMWDQIAVEAVENYQKTVATDEVVVSKTENTTYQETEAATEETTEVTTEETTPVVETDPYGFTISDNPERGSLEIKFDSKPSAEVINALNSNKFRWHKVKKLWFGYADRQTITDALHAAYEADSVKTETKTAMETLEEMGAKPVGKNMLDVTDLMFPGLKQEETAKDLYTEVEQALGQLNKFRAGGYEFSVEHIPSAGYEAKIKRASDGYVSNARGLMFSGMFASRNEAVSDLVGVARNNKLLGDTQAAAKTEEVIDNGKESENGPDARTVHEPVRRSEGPARLLERVEPEAVRSSDDGRQPVQSGSDQGPGDAGRDRRADAERPVSERSTRDRVGGDLQQLQSVSEDNNVGDKMSPAAEDTVTPSKEEKAEQLHEVVQEEIEQKSTINPKGSNFVIGDSLNLPSGTKARVRANIDAIKLVKQIAAEDRIATPAEQEVLSKYVGWGGLADAFGKPVSNYTTRKLEYQPVKGLEAEFEELKTVLTEEEYKSARESTKNAHYTSIEVIKAMYDGLKHLGFTGGRMLEPSSGVGNFVGAMPADMTAQVKSWTMVELDNITGLFAKYLYPNADVRIQGFEESNIPDGYMDVAIGNVPFGNYAITDKHYPKQVTKAIHNYFFAKSLDKVRTGGIVMFITSSYTMNGSDNAVRKYIMQRADLLGAIRLPNTAFSGNAGTSVVTDILILKKRADKTAYAGEAFQESSWTQISKVGYSGANVNEYFVQHPEMVLGIPKIGHGMYGTDMTVEPFTDRGSLGDQIREAMKSIQAKMDYPAQLSPEKSNFRQAAAKKRSQKLQVKDGVIQARDENGNLTKVDVDKDTAARITGMVAIRDAHTALCDAMQQGVKKQEITKLRKALNKAYDSFVEKYGYLNAPKNKKAIKEFADRYAILSLENYSVEGKKVTASKSDIFTKDTIAVNRTAANAENVEEGLTISLNSTGTVDVGLIAKLTGQSADSVNRQLIDQRLVFKDKDGNLIPAAQYLSGNVRAKLREMEGLVGIDKDYQNNVEALKEVVPATVPYTDIYVNPGANWVPAQVYEDFVGHILKRYNHESYRTGKKDFSVEYVPETNEYKVNINDSYAKISAQNTQVWAEGGKSFNTIFENMLNGRRTNVYRDKGDGTRELDRAKTEAVAEKVEKLNEEFRKWLWEDETRRAEMQELYNNAYNALVTPKYSGANLTVNGLNSTYTLRDHQKDAVARIINSGGNTLLAHRVGAGKTMEMAAAAMKLKQLGVIKKPMFVVPNNVVAQWGKEFKDYFPAANILVVGDEDMTAAERMTTINKIKNNDYDAVILAYTKFEKIQMTTAWRQKFYEEQIDSIMFAINAEKESQGGKGFTVKQLENKRKQLEARLKKLTDKAKDEDGAMFEDLGVDSLFVDEAHNFKNLEYSTRMTNVSGLGKADGAQRSFDLYTKVRYLQQLNGGRGVVFATATPVMNSMTEMYIMQKYLQPDMLKQLGIEHFDSWAKMFGEVVNALEIAPSGSGYRLKQTFSKFKNVKALQQMFRSFTDVLTDIPGLKIPKMKGRKVQIVECEQSEFQKNYMAELAKRAENVKNVDPSEDNMLKITSDGRKISYSQRMIDPSLPYEETGKIYKCCENVYNVYRETNKTKGTQMIFCDMATPNGKSSSKTDSEASADEFAAVDMESAQLYDDMKARLVQLGIPAKEIAFIHDAKNDKQKAELSEKMNNGTIRVLIGSTGKMGVGLNAQKKAVAIHHLDAPWRPGDIEQRDGRVFRQRNENEEAYKFVYVTRGSFDSRLWDILDRKQKFINQVMNGEYVGNEIEDTGEVTLSAAEVKAVASDNPLIYEQVALEKEISKLQSLQQAHQASVSKALEMMAQDRKHIALLDNLIANGREDIRNRKDTYSSDKLFSIQIGKQTFTDKKDAGTMLVTVAQANAKEGEYTDIGKFAGFTLRVVNTREGIKGQVSGAGTYEFKVYPLNPSYGIGHLISVVEGIDSKLQMWEKNLAEAKADLEIQKQLAAEPFEQSEKLKQKRARYNEVMDILNPPKEEQSLDTDGGDTVQYQQRKSDRPERRRALRRGEMINEFHNALSASEWHQYYEKIIDGKYNPDLFEDNDLATVTVNEKILLVKMLPNGEFSVQAVWKYQNDIPADDIIEEMKANYDTHNYSDDEIKSWISRISDYDGEKLFVSYDRYSGQFNGDAQRPQTGGRNANEVLGRSGSDGKNILEISTGEGDAGNSAQSQQRTHGLTDREILEKAYDELKLAELPEDERSALDILKGRLDALKDLQNERASLGELYRKQQFTSPADRKGAAQTKNRMQVLDGQIAKAEAAVLAVENKQVLKKVLQKAKKIVEKQQWTKDRESLNRWRDRRNNADAIKKYRTRLKKDVDELTDWVLHPNNKDVVKHIPDVLKSSVIPFLSSVDFTSKRQLHGGDATKADQNFVKRLEALKAAVKPGQTSQELYADYTDLPQDFMEKLDTLIEAANAIVKTNSGEFVVNQMTSEELRTLSQVVANLKAFIKNFNRFHYNAMFKHVYEAGDNSISFMGQMKPASHTGGVSKFVLWDQMRPAYAFERFGKGGEAIYDGLRRGQATMAFNTKEIVRFSKTAYTEAEVKKWSETVKTIKLSNGETVRMSIATAMSFYELSKRPQALKHILGGGIRVATFSDKGKKISDSGHQLTAADVDAIIGVLTDRQKDVADKLQKFMQEQGGKWGNYVSVKRFGEELFGEEHYFPINSDGRFLPANADESPNNASLYALINMGFTKATNDNADNQIVLYNVFDVFSSHMASMAQYNAFALPIIDAIKWFNYKQKGEADENGKREILASVRDQMDKVYGTPEETKPGSGKSGYAQNFVINILKAFNGTEAQGTPYDGVGLQALHHYNRAQVAYNFRVVVQQPLAITRAALMLDYGSIVKGMKLQPAAIERNIEEMRKYSGIAAWKELGFYDVNVSRGLTSLIKHDESAMDKVIDFGMKGAELADTLTWAGIWSACKEEVILKQKLKPKDPGFYDAVTKLFEDVIYKTQVVDSVLTKNQFMRDKGFFARTVGSFMSEPITTASMLVDAFDKFNMDMQRGMTRQQAWQKNRGMIVRTAYVYGVGALVLAAVQAVADALRDDDDYQKFLEKWLEAFGGNLVDEFVVFNKLPIVSDFYELAKELLSKLGVDTYGNPPQSVIMQWYDSLVKGVEIIYGKITGNEDRYTWYGGAYKLLQAASGIFGLPMANATREIVTAWNNSVGAMAPSLKLKTYDAGEMNNIKYAYQDGYLTEAEATAELLDKGLVDTENEAYWTIQGWGSGDGYSRYNAIYDAVLSGGSIDAAMKDLTSHGYTEKDVISQVKSKIGDWYKKGQITKQQATDMLSKYADMDKDDITSTVNKWSSKVVTGIAFEDIKDEFLGGNITEQKAIDMYVRYGGYTKARATELVTAWRSEKETGIVYSDIKDEFMAGKISAAEVKNLYVEYGSYKSREAAIKAAEAATANWNFEKKYGFAYDDRAEAFKSGQVSASTLRTAMIEFGGMTGTEADNYMRAYEWMKKNPTSDLSVSRVLSYTKPIEHLGYSVEDSGVSSAVFSRYSDLRSECKGVDSDNDGTADRNSVKNQVLEVIDNLPITNEQKDALYYLNGWARSQLRKAPWH